MPIFHSTGIFLTQFLFSSTFSTSDIQSTTPTYIDNIPLISTRVDDSIQYKQYYQNENEQDDDIIGEEVRPAPIDSTMDAQMQALHALRQDHTYVQLTEMLDTSESTSIAGATSLSVSSTATTTIVTQSSSATVSGITLSTSIALATVATADSSPNGVSAVIELKNSLNSSSPVVSNSVKSATPLNIPFLYNITSIGN